MLYRSFMQKYRPLYSPDEPAAAEVIPPIDPAIAAAAAAAVIDPAAVVDPVDPAIADPQDPPADPSEPKVHGNKGKTPWYLARISEESERARGLEARALAAEALLERSRANPDPGAPAAARADETAIETRAHEIAEERYNGDRIKSVIQAGMGKFHDWDDRAATLGAAGAATPEFVLDVVSVDPVNAHEILHQLADDPTKAAHLAKMDTRTRTIELVKMSLAAQGKAAPAAAPAVDPKPAIPPKAVSKAPPPPPPVEPGASQAIDWRSDKASDEDFSKGWDARQREKFAGGRR